jgi:hypothetical protein
MSSGLRLRGRMRSSPEIRTSASRRMVSEDLMNGGTMNKAGPKHKISHLEWQKHVINPKKSMR